MIGKLLCNWEILTGIPCKENWETFVVDRRTRLRIPVCTPHAEEYAKDQNEKDTK